MTREQQPPEAAAGSSALGSSLSSDADEREPSSLSGGFAWAGADDDEDRSDITELYERVRQYTADPAEYGRRLAAAHELAQPYEDDADEDVSAGELGDGKQRQPVAEDPEPGQGAGGNR